MRSISKDQYDYLVAIERQDEEAIDRIEPLLPNSELYNRGLYTGIRGSTDHTFEYGSLRITQAGRDILMCYRTLFLSTVSFINY